MKIVGIIPARFASTRFPGKPLADVGGKPMIERVYEQAKKATSLSYVAVATDDERIAERVRSFGGNVILTSSTHQSGTDRCNEAIEHIKKDVGLTDEDVVINIQGDEPFIDPKALNALAAAFEDASVRIATLVRAMKTDTELFNANRAKVIVNKKGEAVYFSRQAIPFIREKAQEDWLTSYAYVKHVGTYAYQCSTLKEISSLPSSALEKAEMLEQLRWIEHGHKVLAIFTEYDNISVDTPEDLQNIWNYISIQQT